MTLTAAQYRQMTAESMLEADLLAKVLGTPQRPGLAITFGWRGYHTHNSQRSTPGFPDLCLVRRGRLIMAELKSQRGRATVEQTAWLTDLHEVAAAADIHASYAQAERMDNRTIDPVLEVYLWRPMDYLDGTIAEILE